MNKKYTNHFIKFTDMYSTPSGRIALINTIKKVIKEAEKHTIDYLLLSNVCNYLVDELKSGETYLERVRHIANTLAVNGYARYLIQDGLTDNVIIDYINTIVADETQTIRKLEKLENELDFLASEIMLMN